MREERERERDVREVEEKRKERNRHIFNLAYSPLSSSSFCFIIIVILLSLLHFFLLTTLFLFGTSLSFYPFIHSPRHHHLFSLRHILVLSYNQHQLPSIPPTFLRPHLTNKSTATTRSFSLSSCLHTFN